MYFIEIYLRISDKEVLYLPIIFLKGYEVLFRKKAVTKGLSSPRSNITCGPGRRQAHPGLGDTF